MRTNTIFALALLCTAFAPAGAMAGAEEDQQACMNDALTVCSQFIPDRDRVAGCLIANRKQISQACRLALARFTPVVQSAKRTSAR